ncbi:S8 family serine peptidase [Arenicella xantha]|uniref:Putative repeat protein (TIGR01451 family) n=1 Tax=Arenicella xantha TaxID=644221 RepID=A0A395JQ04_9GAMM|nr:S8 family serine peptidase [Arenicella xantha]RBP53731.1 putative repeat protein (TIGR01451 family) [Arenicella xantha]
MKTRFSKSMLTAPDSTQTSRLPKARKLAICTLSSVLIAVSGMTTASAQNLTVADKQPTQSVLIPHNMPGNTYIVQLSEPSVASYDGGIQGFAATSAKATNSSKLQTKSPAARQYTNHLRKTQSTALANASSQLGRPLTPKFEYQHAINGFAVDLSDSEAQALAKMPGVKSVQRERLEYTLTDTGPQWIDAPKLWNNGSRSSQGEGMVVAILDSGINSDHPSFADVGGDGYNHENPLGSGNYLPGSYCDTVDPAFCNDKLIGAWDFIDLDGTIPEDDDGHGSHTASTTAGNVIVGATAEAPTTIIQANVSGVAPHANIIAYDVCQRTCPGSALVAAINQVIIDAGNLPNGIAALNYSISGGTDPYNDAVELGFLAAVEAGIYVSASGGNSGPTAGTVAHLGPWVSTTAASTHDRSLDSSLTGLTSSGGGLANIDGASFTSGYGPAPIVNSADYEDQFPGATLCGIGESGEGNTSPFPPGTFNGEIVACTRGAYGRVEKGQNVLFGGAGGYILMDNGAGLVADPHALPAVHISAADGATLATWLADNKDNNPMGSIADFSVSYADVNGDVMGGFSSRGPNNAFSVLKPDVTAPGVSILAALSNSDSPPEYGFLSGTSMSSPHNAGAGALLTAARPDWTPIEIKSALMLTAKTENTYKEDGVTPTDPFDLGAGRIQLGEADLSGLIMSETIANFEAANPALGGDPKTLNLASVMDGNCVGTCSWTRTVTNALDRTGYWNVTATGEGFDADVSITPRSRSRDYNLKLAPGQSGTITVTAENYTSDIGWQFGVIELESKSARSGHGYGHDRRGGNRHRKSGPDLSMPMAVNASKSTDAALFNKTVDSATASRGDILTYEITVQNGQLIDEITVADKLPKGTKFVRGSENEVIVAGSTTTPLSYNSRNKTVTWTGELEPGALQIVNTPTSSPFGFLPLSNLGITPLTGDCNGSCDEGGFYFTELDPYSYNGQSNTEILISVNGTVEAGSASLDFSNYINTELPDGVEPNNILAPFWTDLNLSAGGEMYFATLNAGPGFVWHVVEWSNVPIWSATPGPGVPTVSMQVWMGVDNSAVEGDIHYVYGPIGSPIDFATVGAEDAAGTTGTNYFFDGVGTMPAAGDELLISSVPGGSATLSFQVEAKCRNSRRHGKLLINQANLSSGDTSEQAIAVTECSHRHR